MTVSDCSGSCNPGESRKTNNDGFRRNLFAIYFISLVSMGCGGDTTHLDVPMLSRPVPALPADDAAVGAVVSSSGLSQAGLISAISYVEADLTTAAGAPSTEEPDNQPSVSDAADFRSGTDAGSAAFAPVQEVQMVAPAASLISLSAQAQASLRRALSRGEVRIMPTGDQITQGVGGSPSYRRELAALLDAAGCPYRMVGSQRQSIIDSGYYGAHEGYSGHSADSFLTGQQTESGTNQGIADAVNNQSPDLVLLHLGSADLFAGQTVDSTVADIAAVIDTIHQNKPDTVIVVANVIPVFSDHYSSSLADAVRALGNRLQELVRSRSHQMVSLADVRSGFVEEMMQPDMTHPNVDGDTHIARAIFDSFYSASICQS